MCDKVYLKRHEKFRGTIELSVHMVSLIFFSGGDCHYCVSRSMLLYLWNSIRQETPLSPRKTLKYEKNI